MTWEIGGNPVRSPRISPRSQAPRMMALRSHQRGGPETLVYELAPRPQLLPNEVLISVHAAGITFAELTWEETWTRDGHDRTPIIPSHEVSGVVTEIGSEVRDVEVGSEVFALTPFDRDGAAADCIAVDSSLVAYRPLSVDHAAAAAAPLAALTAWQALVDHAHATTGERILIHGGAGGVGVFAIQIARSLGLEISTTAKSKDREFLVKLGAKHVIDYTRERFDDGRDPYDIVLDGIGGDVTVRSLRVIKPGGRIVTLNGPAPEKLAHRLQVSATFFVVRGSRTGLDRITTLIDGGLLQVVVSATYPLSQGRDAFESVALPNRPPGKTVLIVKNEDSRV